MRIAILTMPENDNAGNALPFVHTALRLDLCRAFGGVTVTNGVGSWLDSDTRREYHESIRQYHVAANWTPALESQFRLIAARTGALAGQMSVFIQLDGNAEFISPDSFLAEYLQSELAAKQAA